LNYVDRLCLDSNKIPVSDGSFDVVLCTEAFEHVPEPTTRWKELSRILVRGGRLFDRTLGERIASAAVPFLWGTPHFYETFLVNCGLEIIEIG
jgi:2-polyprenyl-3-methyl-5-hydroxy-6-metoxy-1,4-benzoquinol methylase